MAFSACQYSQNEILDLLYTGLLCLVLCIVSLLNKSFVQSGLSSAQIVYGHIGSPMRYKDIIFKGHTLSEYSFKSVYHRLIVNYDYHRFVAMLGKMCCFIAQYISAVSMQLLFLGESFV